MRIFNKNLMWFKRGVGVVETDTTSQTQAQSCPVLLRSTADTCKLKIPLFKKKYSGQRSFSYQGPVTWNNLPFSIRHTQTYLSLIHI